MGPERIRVRVACAEAGRQTVLKLELDAGCTAGEAVRSSGIFTLHPDIDAAGCGIGVFGREVPDDYRLQDGDRVEILRPLIEDPRARRRRLANQGRAARRSGRGG